MEINQSQRESDKNSVQMKESQMKLKIEIKQNQEISNRKKICQNLNYGDSKFKKN